MTQLTMDLMIAGGTAIDMNAIDISASLDMDSPYAGTADLMTATSLEFPADLS